MIFNKEFETVEMVELPDDKWGFKFIDLGATIRIDGVRFSEIENGCTMSVNYVIIDGTIDIPQKEFKKMVGDMVVSLLEDKIKIDEEKKSFNLNNKNGV